MTSKATQWKRWNRRSKAVAPASTDAICITGTNAAADDADCLIGRLIELDTGTDCGTDVVVKRLRAAPAYVWRALHRGDTILGFQVITASPDRDTYHLCDAIGNQFLIRRRGACCEVEVDAARATSAATADTDSGRHSGCPNEHEADFDKQTAAMGPATAGGDIGTVTTGDIIGKLQMVPYYVWPVLQRGDTILNRTVTVTSANKTSGTYHLRDGTGAEFLVQRRELQVAATIMPIR